MAFGKTLKNILEEKNISAAELSRRTGIPKTTLSGIFKSDTDKISINLFIQICDAIGCDPTEFYRDYKKRSVYLTDTEHQLLQDFRALNEDGQTAALAAVRGFTMVDQYKKCNNVSEVS